MSGAAIVVAASLVLRWAFVAASWSQNRVRRQMLRNVARIKFRSRTPGGSTVAGSSAVPQQLLPARAGVEPEADDGVVSAAPPAHPYSGVAVSHPEAAAPGPDPVGADVSRGSAFTGPTLAGTGEEPTFEHTVPARPHTSVGAAPPGIPRAHRANSR